jgi:hypothetical protein
MPFSQHNLTSPPQYDGQSSLVPSSHSAPGRLINTASHSTESLSLDALLSQYDVSDFSVEPYQDFEPFVFDLD